MLLDPEIFALPDRLRRAFPVIRREVDALPEESWVRWPNEADVVGTVQVVPLHLTYRPELLPPFERLEVPARRVCAATWAEFADTSVTMVFSRMQPGCLVKPHVDRDGPGFLRCHLGLRVAPGAWMRVGNVRFEWQAGDCVVFDPRQTHEVANESDTERLILIMDFMPSATELATLVARGLPLPLG